MTNLQPGGSSEPAEATASMTTPEPIAICENNEALTILQVQLEAAIIATPTNPLQFAPKPSDIIDAIKQKFGASSIPKQISAFPPDYILQFDTLATRDMILADKILHTSSFRLELSKWTPDYRSHLITWNCEVETLITGIPPHACHPCILGPLLQPYGDIQTYCFNKKKGTCKVITYTSTPTAIPKSGTISFPKRTIQETQLQTFPVSMMTIPSKPAMARTAPKARQWDDGYQYGDLLMETAYEGNVDPDVLYDANVDINQAEDEMLAQKTRHGTSSSEYSGDYDGYSTRGKEYSPSDDLSDREPADWKGKNI